MEFQSPQKLYLLLCLSILFLSSFHAQATSFTYCDVNANYSVKVSGVEISPDPVVPGKPATFKISAVTGEAISGGKLEMGFTYIGVLFHTEIHDLCEEVSCPVTAGNFELARTQTLPAFTPPGTYTLQMTLDNEKNEQLTCIAFDFKIVFASSLSDTYLKCPRHYWYRVLLLLLCIIVV